jgi:hypothetical protein
MVRIRLNTNMRPLSLFVLGIIALLAVCGLCPIQVRTDYAFICENTGSRYGFTKWRHGGQTGNWYQMSPLEDFMKRNHPDRLTHKWTSYAGTGKTLFGRNVSFGHGRPGPILFLDNRSFTEYMAKIPDAEKLRLYETFSSGDRAAASLAVDKIYATLAGSPLPVTNRLTNPTNFE